jgi:hypothetical protein
MSRPIRSYLFLDKAFVKEKKRARISRPTRRLCFFCQLFDRCHEDRVREFQHSAYLVSVTCTVSLGDPPLTKLAPVAQNIDSWGFLCRRLEDLAETPTLLLDFFRKGGVEVKFLFLCGHNLRYSE